MTKTEFQAARSGAELRRKLLHEFQLESAAQLVFVDCAAAALDQALSAERLLKKDGLVIAGSRGLVPHPAAQVAKDARNRLMRALKSLDLDT